MKAERLDHAINRFSTENANAAEVVKKAIEQIAALKAPTPF
jgi:hypothetical protein